ncbi:hypothetical protein [Candidatus Magnetaquicoccus inordinatus]|uniref:hypothetical protein n=1 Tax=Candidatus Magnetaquicoccus inordinatus TaxID=2496818 RepID=UPI00102BFF60|nr:hypothetical protein [Candidatus Magnetaquicoccus inordinatus]
MSFTPIQRRFSLCIVLGGLAAALCITLASRGQAELASVHNPIFWAIVSDRLLIGMVVALAGAYTVHPLLGFSYPPLLRGACMGALVSLPLAAGGLASPASADLTPWLIFWATLLSGAFYGAIIDWLATRFGGEGMALFSPGAR